MNDDLKRVLEYARDHTLHPEYEKYSTPLYHIACDGYRVHQPDTSEQTKVRHDREMKAITDYEWFKTTLERILSDNTK